MTIDIDELERLFIDAGLTRARWEDFNARVEDHAGKVTRRGWSEVLCHAEARSQSQVARCADLEDAKFITAIINAFPYILEELRKK